MYFSPGGKSVSAKVMFRREHFSFMKWKGVFLSRHKPFIFTQFSGLLHCALVTVALGYGQQGM
jgi:hypothetical protein